MSMGMGIDIHAYGKYTHERHMDRGIWAWACGCTGVRMGLGPSRIFIHVHGCNWPGYHGSKLVISYIKNKSCVTYTPRLFGIFHVPSLYLAWYLLSIRSHSPYGHFWCLHKLNHCVGEKRSVLYNDLWMISFKWLDSASSTKIPKLV